MSKKRIKDSLVPLESVDPLIVTIRDQRVIVDADLAKLYGVPTKVLNQAVKRNADRFPADFMFKLTEIETSMWSQSVTTKSGRGGRRYRPYAFTEHGVIMAANVLNSPKAVQISLLVVRAFVRLRQLLAGSRQLADKLNELEGKVGKHDRQIIALIEAIRQLMIEPEPKSQPRIGFQTENASKGG